MPQIPIYNRGQGPTVQMTTGTLGPKLSSQVFERAAAAPGEVAARALGDIANVAADFEVREQKAELEAAERDLMNKADEAADRFVFENNDDNYRAYGINSGNFKTDWLQSNVDTYEGLNNRQRAALSNNIDRRMQLKLQPGKVNAFNRGQARKTDVFNKAAEILVKEMASAVDTPAESGVALDVTTAEEYRAKIKEEADALHESAMEQGLSINWTPDSIVFNATREQLIDFSLNPTTTADAMRREGDLIRGGDGKYSQFTADERAVLSQTLTNSLNKLENEEVANAESNIQGATAAIKLADTADARLAAFANGMENVATLRRAGNYATAQTRESELRAFLSAANTFDQIKYATAAEVTDVILELRETATTLANDPNADLGEVRQAEANLEAAKVLAAERRGKILEDPAGYVASTFQAENDRTPTPTELVDLQRKIGVPEFNIVPFTSAQFDKLSDELKQLDPFEQMDALQSFFGPLDAAGLSNMAMSQAVRSGLTPVQMIAARSLDRGAATRRKVAELLEAEKLHQENKEALDALVPEADQKAIRQKVAELMTDYFQSVVGGELTLRSSGQRLGGLLGMQGAVLKLAVYYASQGESTDAASGKAVALITDRYEFTTAGGQFTTDPLRIPKEFLERPEQVDYMRTIMKKHLAPNGFLESVVAPIEKEDGTVFSEAEMKKYIDEVRLYGAWVNTDDDSGVYLVDQTGSPVIMLTNNLSEQGNFRLEKSFEELADMATEILRIEEEFGDTSYMDSTPFITLQQLMAVQRRRRGPDAASDAPRPQPRPRG